VGWAAGAGMGGKLFKRRGLEGTRKMLLASERTHHMIDAGEAGLYFMVGDVSGKGVAAPILMSRLHAGGV
jgi:hypothetical protein